MLFDVQLITFPFPFLPSSPGHDPIQCPLLFLWLLPAANMWALLAALNFRTTSNAGFFRFFLLANCPVVIKKVIAEISEMNRWIVLTVLNQRQCDDVGLCFHRRLEQEHVCSRAFASHPRQTSGNKVIADTTHSHRHPCQWVNGHAE